MSLRCINQSLVQTHPNLTERCDCRICLTPLQTLPPTFCGCRGYSKDVHPECLLEWVKRRATQKNISRGKVECQLCREEIFLEVKTLYSCYSCLDLLRRNINENHTNRQQHCDFKTKLQQLLCLVLICAIILGVLCQIHESTGKESLMYGIITMSLIIGLCLFVIIGSYFVRRNYQLIGIKGREERVRGREGQRGRVAPVFSQDY